MKAVMLFFLGLLLVLPFISAAYGIGNSNSYGIGSTETSYDIVNAINYTNVNVNNSQWLLGYNWATSPLNASLTAWINGFNYNYNTSSDRVPYTGATQNVNLGENNLTVKSLITTGNVSLNNTLYVSTIGNVGIGTTPATDTNYILLVKRNQDTYTFFRVLNEGTTSGARAGMTLQTGAAGHAGSMQYLSENFVLAPPYDGWRSDSLIFSTGSQADGGIAFINTHASAPTTFNSGGARASDEAMRIAGTTKYVGIGTTTPAEKLGVRGNISASAIYPDLNIQKWNIIGVDSDPYLTLKYDPTPNTFVYETSATRNIAFLQGSNFGIGTTTPTQKLDVNGNISIQGVAHFNYGTSELKGLQALDHPTIYATDGAGASFPFNEYGNLILEGRNSGGQMDMFFYVGGKRRVSIFPTETVINDEGEVHNFRVESDTDANALFVNGTTGEVTISQNLQVSGNHTGNNFYGGMWMYNITGIEGTYNETYQSLYFDTAQNLNGFSFASSTLTLKDKLGAGMYQATYNLGGMGTNNHLYNSYVFINGVAQNNTFGHTIGMQSNYVQMTGLGFIRLNVNDNVTIKLADLTSSAEGTQITSNINLIRVGN